MNEPLRRLKSLWFIALVTACAGEDGNSGSLNLEAPGVGILSEQARIDGYVEALVPVRGLLLAEDGSLVVGQPQNFEVRVFDENGASVGRFGRNGDGPGEFRGILTIGWRADTLWVFDQSHHRMSFISSDLELVRTEPVPVDVQASDRVPQVPSMARPVPVGIDPDGSLLASFLFAAGVPQPQPFNDSWVVSRISQQGILERVVAQVPRGQVFVTTLTGSAQVPFQNRGIVAVSPHADRFAGAFAPLEGDHAGIIQVWTWNSDGENVWSGEYPVDLRAIPQAVADSAMAARMEDLPDELRSALRDQYRVPTHYSPLEYLLYGNDGMLWVGMAPEDGMRPYLVLDPSGEPVGRVDVPKRGRVAAASQDVVWVIEQDELDVESIVRYSVEWN